MKVEQRRESAELSVGDSTWLTLGQLRDLVRRADELGWDDRSLISQTQGRQHIRRHDVQITTRLVIEEQRLR